MYVISEELNTKGRVNKKIDGFLINDGDPYGNACVFWEGTFGSYNGGGKKSLKKNQNIIYLYIYNPIHGKKQSNYKT